jgi:hypothetical protein
MHAMVTVTAAAMILAWNPIAPANTPAPPAPAKAARATAPVVIKTEVLKGEEKNVKAKIVIPKKFVHAGAGVRIIPGEAAPGAAPLRGDVAPTGSEGLSSLPMGSVIAGLALSLAAVSAVFVLRGNRNTKTAALAVLAGAIVLGALGVANADLIVPGRERPREPALIVIELTDDGDSVTLLLAK